MLISHDFKCTPGLQCLHAAAAHAEQRAALAILGCVGMLPKLISASGATDRLCDEDVPHANSSAFAATDGCSRTAVIISGLPHAPQVTNRTFAHSDVFLHTDGADKWAEEVNSMVARLQPVAWRAVVWDLQPNNASQASTADFCAAFPAKTSCHVVVSHDHRVERQVGCVNLACHSCDLRKFVHMGLRRQLGWRLALAHEAARRRPYALVVYVRTDLLEAREVLHMFALRSSLEAAVDWGTANPNSVRVSQYRNFGQWGSDQFGSGVPSDNAALLGRQAAVRYFSTVLAFGVCQPRAPLEQLCGKAVKCHGLAQHTMP